MKKEKEWDFRERVWALSGVEVISVGGFTLGLVWE